MARRHRSTGTLIPTTSTDLSGGRTTTQVAVAIGRVPWTCLPVRMPLQWRVSDWQRWIRARQKWTLPIMDTQVSNKGRRRSHWMQSNLLLPSLIPSSSVFDEIPGRQGPIIVWWTVKVQVPVRAASLSLGTQEQWRLRAHDQQAGIGNGDACPV